MFSKDLSILFIFIAGQSNFETALATCCAALSNLKFVTAALVLKSLPTPGLELTYAKVQAVLYFNAPWTAFYCADTTHARIDGWPAPSAIRVISKQFE